MFALIKFQTSLKMGHVGSKTRSQGQKHIVCSRGHIFCPILMKLGQNVSLSEISNKFKNGLCLMIKKKTPKNRSLGQILEKIVYALKATF